MTHGRTAYVKNFVFIFETLAIVLPVIWLSGKCRLRVVSKRSKPIRAYSEDCLDLRQFLNGIKTIIPFGILRSWRPSRNEGSRWGWKVQHYLKRQNIPMSNNFILGSAAHATVINLFLAKINRCFLKLENIKKWKNWGWASLIDCF